MPVGPELSGALQHQQRLLNEAADKIWKLEKLGGLCRALPNLLRYTARQLNTLDISQSLPVEVSAGCCRAVFEANVTTRLIVTDPAALKNFEAERLYDEKEFLEIFSKLTDESDNRKVQLIERIHYLEGMAIKHNLPKPKKQTWRDKAKVVGLEHEYSTLYGFYSKYTHASSWQINASKEARDGDYRNILVDQCQFYSADTYMTATGFAGIKVE
jgi:hypothetical protein